MGSAPPSKISKLLPAPRAKTDQLANRQIPRFFPLRFHVHTPFMPATLELNTSHNHLYDSTLRHARNCIDSPLPRSKIEIPKPQHVVSVRALDTIGCGSWRPQSSLLRVLGSHDPKSGAHCRIGRSLVDPIACVQPFMFLLVGCPLTLALGRMPRWPQQILNQ